MRQKEGLSYGVGSQFGADALDKSARFMMFAIYNPTNKDKVDAAIADELDEAAQGRRHRERVDRGQEGLPGRQRRLRPTGSWLPCSVRSCPADRTFAYYGNRKADPGPDDCPGE